MPEQRGRWHNCRSNRCSAVEARSGGWQSAFAKMLLWGLPIAMMSGLSGSIGVVRAEAPLHDPNLPSVSPEALQDLKDTRTRQDIIQDSLSRYPNRCVCPYQTQDLIGALDRARGTGGALARLPVRHRRLGRGN